jgi:hypothetical protein
MRYLTLCLLLALACPMRAEAEPASVRCDGKYFQEQQTYFVTYDIEKGHFIFERAGGNNISGEIISANDEQLNLSLRGDGGRILLSYNRTRNMMIWPGLPAGELGRSLLQHRCTAVTGRTMLSTYYQMELFDPKLRDPIDAFSITCPGNHYSFFITLDRVTKAVVLETEGAARLMSGNITDINDGVIKFNFGRDTSDLHDALWDERNHSLTLLGAAGDPTRPLKVQECVATKPRSIMEGYKNWAYWGK